MITKGEIHESVMRILSFYTYLNAPQISHYIDSLHEAFGENFEPGLFDRACIEVMKAMDADSKALPKPGEYRAHYYILQDRVDGRRSLYDGPALDPQARERVSHLLHDIVDKWDGRFRKAYEIDGKEPPKMRKESEETHDRK